MANKSLEKEVDELMEDASLESVRERARQNAKECKIYYDAYQEAGFNADQAFELLINAVSWSSGDVFIDDDEQI